MQKSSTFQHQQIGFFFSINGIRSTEVNDLPEAQMEAAESINARAYQKIENALPQLPEWIVRDASEPEICYSPFEVCEEYHEPITNGEMAAFSVWLHSQNKITEETAKAFLAEAKKCYTEAAQELEGQCQYLYTESQVTEKVTTSEKLAI